MFVLNAPSSTLYRLPHGEAHGGESKEVMCASQRPPLHFVLSGTTRKHTAENLHCCATTAPGAMYYCVGIRSWVRTPLAHVPANAKQTWCAAPPHLHGQATARPHRLGPQPARPNSLG
eukprot:358288-Chlamydomonas_euryale.AAC.3